MLCSLHGIHNATVMVFFPLVLSLFKMFCISVPHKCLSSKYANIMCTVLVGIIFCSVCFRFQILVNGMYYTS